MFVCVRKLPAAMRRRFAAVMYDRRRSGWSDDKPKPGFEVRAPTSLADYTRKFTRTHIYIRTLKKVVLIVKDRRCCSFEYRR